MKKIGILGGTFDPPHIGHLIIANEVYDQLQLDEVWFIPTYEPPHKEKAASTSENRLEMLQLAIAGNDAFHINDLELKRKGKSYTVDTMRELTAQEEAEFYFIIGADNIEYLPYWHEIDKLMQMVEFVGVQRTSYKTETPYPVTLVDVPLVDVSSSFIRKKIKQEASVRYWINDQVYDYIKEHQLYGYRKI